MIDVDPDGEGDGGELLDELDELGPEGETFEQVDLNDCNDWQLEP